MFLECRFPERLATLAARTGRLCYSALAAEMRKVGRQVRWIVVHRKAAAAAEIARELEKLGLDGV